MIIRNVSLETVCGITSRLPENRLPEIAFAGKSNVGKSSLINGLLNRKSLARTSSQPGKTQTSISITSMTSLYFVDLPGYGYAKVSVAVKEKWGKMIERYLRKSQVLKAVFLLIDIRHEPSGNDRAMYDWICHNGFTPIIIATKADQAEAQPDSQTSEGDPPDAGSGSGCDDTALFGTDETGPEEIWDVIGQNIQQEDE